MKKPLLDFIKKIARTKNFTGCGQAKVLMTGFAAEASKVLDKFYETMPQPNSDTCKVCWENGENGSYSEQIGGCTFRCPKCGDQVTL